MNLNISNMVFQNEKSNQFLSQYKENIFIADHYKQKLKNFIKTKTQNILKTFETSCVQFYDGDLILGDKGGFIFRLTELSVCSELYEHDNPIIWLKLNESENIIYSACQGNKIKSYNLNKQTLEAVIECKQNNGSVMESNKYIYQATIKGQLFIYDKLTLETFKVINISKIGLNSITENYDSLFVSDQDGIVYLIDKEKLSIKQKYNLQQNITKILFDKELRNLIISDVTGMLTFCNRELEKVKQIQFSDSKITDFYFLTDQETALVLQQNGSVNVLNIEQNTFEEIRRNFFEGDQKMTFNYKKDIFYVIGHEGIVEKWILKQQQILTRIYRSEIFSEEIYEYQFFNNVDNKLYCFCQTHLIFLILTYQIADSLKKNIVDQKIEVQDDVNGEIIYANSFEQFPDYIYIGLSNLQLIVYQISSNKVIKTIDSFKSKIVSINYNQKKNNLVVCESNGILTFWNAQTYQSLQKLNIPLVQKVIFCFQSNDEDIFYLLKQRGNCQAFNLKDKIVLVDRIINEDDIQLVSYCENKKMIFTSQEGGIIIQTVLIGNEELEIKEIIDRNSEIISMQVDNDGRYLAYCTDKRCVYLYDIEKQFKFDKMGKNFFDTKIMFFSPNRNLIFCSGDKANVKGFKIIKSTQSEVFQSFNQDSIYSVALNDLKIFISKEQFMEVWSIYNNDLEQLVSENYEPAVSMTVDESGEILYSAHHSGKIKIWSTQTLKLIDELIFFEDQGDLMLMEISQDQQIMVNYYESQAILIFDLQMKNILFQFKSQVKLKSLKISPNNNYIAAEISTSQLFIYSIQGEVISFIGKKSNYLRGYDFTKDSNYITMIYRDSMVTLWDINNGENVNVFEKLNKPVNDTVFSKDRNTIFVLTNRGELCYMSTANGVYYKIEKISTTNKTRYLINYNDKLIYTNTNKIFFYDATEKLSFFVQQYIKKSFFDYGKTSSEKDFLMYFKYLEEYYRNSEILQTYFNPILVCALFNYQGAIQQILKEKICSYPLLNDQNQISPLILAIKLGNLNLAQIILRNLSLTPEKVLFSNREMKELISAEFDFTHKYLKNFIIEIKNFSNSKTKIPLLSQFQQKISLNIDNKSTFTPQKFKELTTPIFMPMPKQDKKETLSTESRIRRLKTAKLGEGLDNSDIDSEIQDTQRKYSEKSQQIEPMPQRSTIQLESGTRKTEQDVINQQQKVPKMVGWISTKFYRINGIYSFKTGSKESLDFLLNFSQSQSKEFVLSNWRFIIDYKWNRLFWQLIPTTILIWALSIFYSLYLLYPQSNIYLIGAIISLFLNLLYETVSMFLAKPSVFLRSIFNIIDLCIIVFGFAILAATFVIEGRQEKYDVQPLKYFQIMQLFFMYFRAMTYLRIFYFFRNVIHMLIDITMTSTSFLLIIFSFVLAFNVMFLKASDRNDDYNSRLVQEFTSLQGQIDFDEDNFSWLEWTMFILNSILLPIILINFLIAKMSNKYEELEQHEQFTSYVEKAKLIAEIEYFHQIKNTRKDFQQIRGFTFITRNSQKDKHQEQQVFQDKLEENFETFEQKINEIYKMYQQQQQEQEEWNFKLVKELDVLKNNFENVKEDLEIIKEDQVINSQESQHKIKQLEEIMQDRIDYIQSKFDELKPKKKKQNQDQRNELRQITQLTNQQQNQAIKNVQKQQKNDIIGVENFVELQQEEVENIKQEIIKENEDYLKSHPEIQKMLNIFMIKILHEQPKDTITFAGNFFSKYFKKKTFKQTHLIN